MEKRLDNHIAIRRLPFDMFILQSAVFICKTLIAPRCASERECVSLIGPCARDWSSIQGGPQDAGMASSPPTSLQRITRFENGWMHVYGSYVNRKAHFTQNGSKRDNPTK